VCLCFVWIWEQTAIISLYSINWLVFITETECVYCAVRTGSLSIIQVNLFCGLIDLSPRRRTFDPRSVHVRFVVVKVALRLVFLLVLRFSFVSIIPRFAPYSSSHTCRSYPKDKRAKQCSFGNGGALDKKVRSLLVSEALQNWGGTKMAPWEAWFLNLSGTADPIRSLFSAPLPPLTEPSAPRQNYLNSPIPSS
jgi:hypothetical protein